MFAREVWQLRKIQRASNARPYSYRVVACRGRRCGVAQRSMPQWGIEPHERASFAGWRRSLCAAKRRRPVNARIFRADIESAPTAHTQIGVCPVRADASIGPYRMGVEGIWPRRGQTEEDAKALRKMQHSCIF